MKVIHWYGDGDSKKSYTCPSVLDRKQLCSFAPSFMTNTDMQDDEAELKAIRIDV